MLNFDPKQEATRGNRGEIEGPDGQTRSGETFKERHNVDLVELASVYAIFVDLFLHGDIFGDRFAGVATDEVLARLWALPKHWRRLMAWN